MLSSSRVARTLALTAAPLAALALAGPAAAATKNGITPLAPKAGTSVPAGKAATFRMRVTDPGAGVFVHVCKNNRRNKEGMICKKATILQAKKRKGAFEAKQTVLRLPRVLAQQPRHLLLAGVPHRVHAAAAATASRRARSSASR